MTLRVLGIVTEEVFTGKPQPDWTHVSIGNFKNTKAGLVGNANWEALVKG